MTDGNCWQTNVKMILCKNRIMPRIHYTKIRIALVVTAGVIAIVTRYGVVRAQTPPAPTRSVWDGVYTDAQAKRGEQIYLSDCSSCHGKHLDGVDDAPALAGKDFLDSWNGRTLGALLAKMRKMPRDAPGSLSQTEYADTLAYVLSMNKFPPGKAELPQDIDLLRQVRVEAKPTAKK
jgi:mono/diheme cytochrome c family protein